ncbi:hypothetical protein CRUP_010111 [Coryphaenoides rupestris]|nr:hypothetical protein CRUP_010111 [Coryphaenoides rupestris]
MGVVAKWAWRQQLQQQQQQQSRIVSKLTQSIVKDHMVSHYKKIYSAKDNDQLKRDQLRRGGRPQSAHSVLQGHGRDSRSSKESRGSLQGENSPLFCSGSSIFSTPRHLNTSFHAKQVVYPSHGARSRPRCPDTASEFSFRRSETDLYRQHSAWPASPASGAHQSPYAAFKDPVQKTYSGDLLHKHAHYFTHHDQPFTPRTLKSDKSSSLSKRELKQHTTLDYDDQPQVI